MKKFVIAILIFGVLSVVSVVVWLFFESNNDKVIVYKDTSLTNKNINIAINRGIDFLVKNQQPNGEFFLYLCDNTQPERCEPISSGPNTGAVLLMLSPLSQRLSVNRIVRRGLEYVKSTAESTTGVDHAIWNIFAPTDSRHGRVPPDMDGVAIASLILEKYNIKFSDDEKSLYKFRNSGDLFYNWLSDEWNNTEIDRHAFAGGDRDQFSDPNYFGIDCVVNADVLSYLAYKGDQPKPLCDYLNNVVKEKLYPQCTFYYRSPYMLFVSMALAAKDSNASCLEPSLKRIKSELLGSANDDGTWSLNHFSNVVSALTLIKLGEHGNIVKVAVENILDTQQEDGGWENAIIFPDLYNPVFYGSREMVTAVAVRALFEYKKAVSE